MATRPVPGDDSSRLRDDFSGAIAVPGSRVDAGLFDKRWVCASLDPTWAAAINRHRP